MKSKIFFLFLFLITTSIDIYSQNQNKVEKTVLEILSTDKMEEVSIEILIIVGEDESIPFEVKEITTPYKLVLNSKNLFAIVKCANPSKMYATLTNYNKNENELTKVEGSAEIFILRKVDDMLSFEGIK